MIIGIGTDIVNIERIEQIIQKFGTKFLRKIFTAREINNAAEFTSQKRINAFFAKRFAAKEAYAKATGVGIRGDITFKQIEVYNDQYGRPSIILGDHAVTHLKSMIPPGSSYDIHLSLSDDYPLAIAYVLISANTLK